MAVTISNTQQQALGTYVKLMRCAESVTSRIHGHLADVGLTMSQFGVLDALYHLGPLCLKDIGRKILKTSGNMTLVVDNLEKRQLVERQVDPEDRRYIRVVLTASGKELIEQVLPVHAEAVDGVFGMLNRNDMNTLGRLLRTVGHAAAPNE